MAISDLEVKIKTTERLKLPIKFLAALLFLGVPFHWLFKIEVR